MTTDEASIAYRFYLENVTDGNHEAAAILTLALSIDKTGKRICEAIESLGPLSWSKSDYKKVLNILNQ